MGLSKDREKIAQFVRKIKRIFNPCKVFIFGSRARGDFWAQSDYDLIIISDKFEGVGWLDRISTIVKHWNLDYNLDVIPYTTKEFEHKKKESSFIREIVLEAKKI